MFFGYPTSVVPLYLYFLYLFFFIQQIHIEAWISKSTLFLSNTRTHITKIHLGDYYSISLGFFFTPSTVCLIYYIFYKY